MFNACIGETPFLNAVQRLTGDDRDGVGIRQRIWRRGRIKFIERDVERQITSVISRYRIPVFYTVHDSRVDPAVHQAVVHSAIDKACLNLEHIAGLNTILRY